MAFLYALEYLFMLLLVLVVATQIVWPLWQGELLFPLFRSRRRRAEANIADARENADVSRLNSIADRIRKEQKHDRK